jgi:hypothetical protein
MPSAGRPFTRELVASLISRGVRVAPITLHTGVSSPEVGEAPAPERYIVPQETADLVKRHPPRGRTGDRDRDHSRPGAGDRRRHERLRLSGPRMDPSGPGS